MKHILVGFAALFVSLSTQAAYLLWQVDTSDYSDFASAASVNKYVLYAIQDGQTSGTQIDVTSVAGQKNQVESISNYSNGYSFYVELVNWESSGNETALARSATVSYTELSGHIAATLSDVSSVSAWHASGYTAVPEPSSAVLLMLGMGLLALKRRK